MNEETKKALAKLSPESREVIAAEKVKHEALCPIVVCKPNLAGADSTLPASKRKHIETD